MLEQLGNTNCPANLYEITEGVLSDREVTYEKNGAKVTKQYTRGCPQYLRPLLWNVVRNSELRLELGKMHTCRWLHSDRRGRQKSSKS